MHTTHFFLLPVPPAGREMSAHTASRVAADPFVRDPQVDRLREEVRGIYADYAERLCDENNWSQEIFLVTPRGMVLALAERGDDRGRDRLVDEIVSELSSSRAPNAIEHLRRFVIGTVRGDLIFDAHMTCSRAGVAEPEGIASPAGCDADGIDPIAHLNTTLKDVAAVLSAVHDVRSRTDPRERDMLVSHSVLKLTRANDHAEDALRGDDPPFLPDGCSPYDEYRAHDLTDLSPGDHSEDGKAVLAVDIHT